MSVPILSSLHFQFIQVQRFEDLVVLSINDPPANTLTYDLMLQLDDIFLELSLNKDIRAAIIIGAGEKFFCGGVNIGMLRNVSPHYNSNFLLYASEVFERIDKAPFLVVAAINGHATGGGLELALVADVRIAIAGAYNIGFPEVRLGVIPGLGGTQRLSRLVGPGRALELITMGEFVSVTRAEMLGVVDKVVPPHNFLAAVVSQTRELLQTIPPPRGHEVTSEWCLPERVFAAYERHGRIGVITLTAEAIDAPTLQVLWSLNRAILSARLDEYAEVLLITHSEDTLRLGVHSPGDPQIWGYAQAVYERLENVPRLCVLAFRGALDPLTTELALACDYRLIPDGDAASESLLEISARSSRSRKYATSACAPAEYIGSIASSYALDVGLVRAIDTGQWPDAVLKWLRRFVSPHGAAKAIGYAKLAIVKGVSFPHEAGVLLERHLQEQLFRGYDGPEGMSAYLEKRAAVFKGE